MDLSRISIVLRPRTAWEAIDLGFAMARSWFRALWLLWLCGALPVYLLASALLPESGWLVPALVVWWFKPLYEPPLLYWAGRALFADPPGGAEMAKRWPGVTLPRLVANLTWRRFDPYRSFNMGVTVLEGLRGRAHRDRALLLGRNQHAAAWLTVFGLSFELVLQLSFIVLVIVMIPEELRWADTWTLAFGTGELARLLGELGALLAMSLMAPFYVAAGFSLYMNRRSELEGWDIELGFRRIAARHTGQAVRRPPAGRLSAAVAVVAVGALLLGPGKAPAATVPDRQEAKALIQEVLADPDFGREETDTYWHYVGDRGGEDDEPRAGWLGEWLEWLVEVIAGFTKGIAAVGEVVLWLAVGFLLAFVAAWAIRHRGGAFSRPGAGAPGDGERFRLFNLDVSPESLPRDVPGTAAALAERGELRGALSLLYRGALARFVADRRPDIPPGATEGECLALVRRDRSGRESAYFGELSREWIRLAYAHRVPDPGTVKRLCRRWREVDG